jgi:hypothetical protein
MYGLIYLLSIGIISAASKIRKVWYKQKLAKRKFVQQIYGEIVKQSKLVKVKKSKLINVKICF